MSAGLLPCPFCNDPPTVLKKGNEHTRMSVTILCPKCRAERTDATPKTFNHANHDWLLAIATKNWNKRTIAPPVAAGSVDTGMYALKAKAMAATAGPWQLEDDDVGSGPAPVLHIGQPDNYALRIAVQHAHEFPQRKPRLAGKEWESLVSQCRANADFIAAANPTAILGLIERAEKAEADLKARDFFVDVLNCQVKKAQGEADVLFHRLNAANGHLTMARERIEELETEIKVLHLG